MPADSLGSNAQEELYRSFSGRVAAYIASLLPSSPAIPDLTHDVFVKAFQSHSSYQGETRAIGGWLFAIARNTVTDHARRTTRTASEAPASIDRRREAARRDDHPDWGDYATIHELVDELPRAQREVVVLHYCAGLDTAEVAVAVDRSPDAVRHLEQRALTALRNRLGERP